MDVVLVSSTVLSLIIDGLVLFRLWRICHHLAVL
jgi:hypothetical protein